MRATAIFLALFLLCMSFPTAQTPAGKTLDIYYVDTEGGQATLFVSPSGESLLVDTGSPGGRDTDRIMEAVTAAGLKQIDYLLITHYHGDHVGGFPELAARIPIRNFIDHGPTIQPEQQQATLATYALATSPGLEDLWQLHWSHNGLLEHNAPSAFIANIDEGQALTDIIASPPAPVTGLLGPPPARGQGGRGGRAGGPGAVAPHSPAYWIKVSALADGTFTVTNARNGFTKTYRPRS